MGNYVLAEDFKEIAQALKEKYPINLEEVDTERIVFLRELDSDKSKSYAFTKKIEPLYKVINSSYDYMIVFFDKLIVDFTPGQLHTLVLHELLHIGGVEIDAKGNEKVKLIDHDVKDFFSIVTAFGADWAVNPECKDPLMESIDIKDRINPQDGQPRFVDEE